MRSSRRATRLLRRHGCLSRSSIRSPCCNGHLRKMTMLTTATTTLAVVAVVVAVVVQDKEEERARVRTRLR